jgi:hypothetical protein
MKEMPELYFTTKAELDEWSGDSYVSLGRWNAAGQPHLWVLCETDGDATLWKDHGHGCMLLKNGDATDRVPATQFICHVGNVIGMDKEYFDLPKGIWR